MKFWTALYFCFFASICLNAQALPIIEKDGQKYYQYEIIEGQNLIQLQSLFKCDADELLTINPGLERGVEVGQSILAPVLRGPLTHKVEPQQTLYAISRLYEVPLDSLYSWNPSAQNGLKAGQDLLLQNVILPLNVGQLKVETTPVFQSKFAPKITDTILTHTVLEKETLYAISKRYMVPVDSLKALNKMASSRVSPGQQILVPIHKPKTSEVPIQVVPQAQRPSSNNSFSFPVPSKESYHIAIFLPFQLDSIASQNRFVAAAALDYYMGMKMALDSLQKMGLSAVVHVYDENAADPNLSAILSSDDMSSVDLIFSPLQEKQARIVATFAKENGIPVVFPVQMPKSIVEMSPNFIAYTTSDEALVENLAHYIHQNYQGHTVVLIGSTNAEEKSLEQKFKSAFAALPTTQSKLKLQEATWANYSKFKTVGGQQLLVSFSSDRAKVVGLFQAALADGSLTIVGHKDWLDYKELDVLELRNQSFLVSLPSYFDYHNPQIIPFHKDFRKRYHTDLTKMACLGYDVTLHIGKQLLATSSLQNGLISNLKLSKTANGLFIENKAAVVVSYRNAQLLVP